MTMTDGGEGHTLKAWDGALAAMERTRLLKPVFGTVLALKSFERIGDHARNVAEHVVFLVSGDDVRHAAARRGTPAREYQH